MDANKYIGSVTVSLVNYPLATSSFSFDVTVYSASITQIKN
jgi:hypothetical protein